MDINERFKTLRKAKKLSQTEFGEHVGVSRSVINNIERKLVEPKDLFVKQVCKEYHVNYLWLTDGFGEMFSDDEDYILDELSEEFNLDELDKKIIEIYLKLSHEDKMVFKNFLKQIFDEK
ncbi:helix-turn-helix transcriptional regulator [Ruminococcus sp. YE282]|uniref:helix-turn-helix domain-containing protein n=1 Tax=Ruminococcus sp. YE282 TaxID=3158780 RepID=UPI00088E13AA|nr:DNA-binding transcriptional regulator, XRE-family HTH domain [Ruminococcus bromii]